MITYNVDTIIAYFAIIINYLSLAVISIKYNLGRILAQLGKMEVSILKQYLQKTKNSLSPIYNCLHCFLQITGFFLILFT